MCTYVTEHVAITASAKGAEGWHPVSEATVYFDHPVHVALDHSLNIDLFPAGGGVRCVGVELSPDSARALAQSILSTLATAEATLGAEAAR